MTKIRRPIVIESMERRVLLDATVLTDAVISSSLPASFSDQTVAHGKVMVTITNNSGVTQKEKVSVDVVVTPAGSLDLQAQSTVILATKGYSGTLVNGQSKPFTEAVTVKKGELGDGTYTVYAVAADPEGGTSQSAAGPTFTVTAPVVTLSETESIAKLPKSSVTAGEKLGLTDKVTVVNSGTDASTTPLTVDVYATPDGTVASGTLVGSATSKATIGAGKKGVVPVKLATVPATLTAGTYDLIAAVTQANGTVTASPAASSPTLTVSGGSSTGGGGTGSSGTGTSVTSSTGFTSEIVSVRPQYSGDSTAGNAKQEHIVELSVTLTVANNSGASTEIDGSDVFTFTLYASASPTFSSSDTPVAVPSNAIANIAAGKSYAKIASFDIPEANTSLEGTTVDDYIFVQVTDPAGGTAVVGWSAPIQFFGPAS
jgi:hypothetical protein